jgi:hypothetical protein
MSEQERQYRTDQLVALAVLMTVCVAAIMLFKCCQESEQSFREAVRAGVPVEIRRDENGMNRALLAPKPASEPSPPGK